MALHWLGGVALGVIASVWWDGEGVVVVTGIGAASWEIFEIGYPGPAEFLHGTPPASMVAHDTLLDVPAVVGGSLMLVWLGRQHNE
jgi:hypothetical protein